MDRMSLVKLLLRPFGALFGSGLGNVKILKYVFDMIVSRLIPKQYVIIEANDCKLGMNIGGDRGLDVLAGGIMFGNGYEVQTTKLFKSLVKPGMTVVDVGAHVGYYTTLASKLVGNRGKVIAFEPELRNYNNLEKNIKLNRCGNVFTFPKAVGAESTKAKLFVSDKASGECSLIDIKSRPNMTVDVDVITLDEYINDKVDVIKIDVDGGEMGVLLGARHLIEDNVDVKIFTEVWIDGLESAGYSFGDYWDKLQQYGLKYIYLIDEKQKIVRDSTREDILRYLDNTVGVNLLCSKDKVDIDFEGMIPQKLLNTQSKRVQKRVHILCGLLKKSDNVLDVGCGTGEYITKYLGYLPINITAIDLDNNSIQYAATKNLHKNVKYVVANGESFCTDDRFNLIICSHILEHLREPLVMLYNLQTLLKDDGIIYVGIPNGYGDFEIENFIPRMLSRTSWGERLIARLRSKTIKDSLNVDSQHIQFYTYKKMMRLLRQSGLEIIQCVNEELFGGVISDRIISRLPLMPNLNSKIADILPRGLANSWVFICKKI